MKPFLKIKIGLIIACSIFLFLVLYHLINSSHTPYRSSLQSANLAPCWNHFFGTDELGRDLFARVHQGTSISVIIGILAFIIDMTIGVIWGVISALTYPSYFSMVLRRFSEVLYSVPYLLVVIFIVSFTGPGITPLIIAMICMSWIQVSRITEKLVLQVLQSDYILAERILGIRIRQIIFKHIFPNIYPNIFAVSLMSIPQAIFSEAFLSFLGVGIQPPIASLGTLINNALPSLSFYPWRLLFPAGMITLLVLAATFLSDGFISLLNPKTGYKE